MGNKLEQVIVTLNCRKAPFFRYGDIRQGFIKML